MGAPTEFTALLAFLFLLSGGHRIGALDPITGALGQAWSYLKAIAGARPHSPPISIENRNIEHSDARVEVHLHYHDRSERQGRIISDGGSGQKDAESE